MKSEGDGSIKRSKPQLLRVFSSVDRSRRSSDVGGIVGGDPVQGDAKPISLLNVRRTGSLSTLKTNTNSSTTILPMLNGKVSPKSFASPTDAQLRMPKNQLYIPYISKNPREVSFLIFTPRHRQMYKERDEAEAAKQREIDEAKRAIALKEALAEYTRLESERRKLATYFHSRKRLLTRRLELRPRDKRSMLMLIDIVYEQKDFVAATQIIKKAINLGHNSAELYLKLGRSYFRRWFIDRTYNDLVLAGESFYDAFKDPSMKYETSPVAYFEMFSIQLRLGHYQAALDAIGVGLTRFKDDKFAAWGMIAQYNVAQTMLLLGQLNKAMDVYQQLSMLPLLVEADVPPDNVMFVTKRIVSSYVSLEMARILQRQGKDHLAKLLFEETWDRVKKYGKEGKLDTRTSTVGASASYLNTTYATPSESFDLSSIDGPVVNICFEEYATFEEWYNNYQTFEKIAMTFKRECNLFMAAEYYGLASEMFAASECTAMAWKKLPLQKRNTFLRLILDRGDCLAELHAFDQAEFCAKCAYDLAPADIVVIGRAYRCCRPDTQLGKAIATRASQTIKAVQMVQRALLRKVAQRRRQNRVRIAYFASKIASVIRMCLVRNRMAGDRCGGLSAVRIARVAAYLQRTTMKLGKQSVAEWMEVWTLNALMITKFMRFHTARRRRVRFWKGLQSLKRIFIGQLTRRRLQKRMYHLQLKLDKNPDFDERYELQLHETMFRGIRFIDIERLSAGVTCLTINGNFVDRDNRKNDQDDFSVGDHSANDDNPDYIFNLKSRKLRLLPPTGLPDESPSSPSSMTSKFYSERMLAAERAAKNAEETKKTQRANDARIKRLLGITEATPPSTAGNSSSSMAGNAMSLTNTFPLPKSPAAAGMSWFRSSLDFNKEVPNKKKLTGREPSRSLKKIKEVGDGRVDHHSDDENDDISEFTGAGSATSTVATVSISSSMLSQTDLQKQVLNCLRGNGEDVFSLISQKSVSSDPSVQWIPFGLIYDAAIYRILTCTVLAITSPSFSMNDSKRLCAIAKQPIPHSEEWEPHQRQGGGPDNIVSPKVMWDNIRSLIIYGTKMGPSGMLAMMRLGITNLHTLSIGYTGITHIFGNVIGKQLMNKPPKMPYTATIKMLSRTDISYQPFACHLRKLYIDSEHKLEDRGAIDLFKCLQYNDSLRIISIRNCGLTKRSAVAFARYLGVNQSLEVAILNDNLFTADDVLTIVRAVANKGIKSRLQYVSLKGLDPALTREQQLHIYQMGASLQVKIVASTLDFLDEIHVDTSSQGIDGDANKIKAIPAMVRDMNQRGKLELVSHFKVIKKVLL